MKNYIVRKKILIRAKPTEVWDALTDPEKTEKYFFNCRAISDWKPGSPIVFKGKFLFFIKFELSGTIIAVDPPKLLKYSLKNSRSSGMSMVTENITYENGITTLSITDDVGSGNGSESRYKRSNRGWDKILTGLKTFLERQN